MRACLTIARAHSPRRAFFRTFGSEWLGIGLQGGLAVAPVLGTLCVPVALRGFRACRPLPKPDARARQASARRL